MLDETQRLTAKRLLGILSVASSLTKQQYSGKSGNVDEELERVRTAADGSYSDLLLRNVSYAWIREHPASLARRWLSRITTTGQKPEEAKQIADCLKLWWVILQEHPDLWAKYTTLAMHQRYEEAGEATALDLVDLHDDFVKLCGDDPKLRFNKLMQADLSQYKRPLGFLP